MSNRDDGGPAFPSGNGELGVDGMSLRDWFAGQALAACIARCVAVGWGYTEAPRLAYEAADLMLAARKKDQPHE